MRTRPQEMRSDAIEALVDAFEQVGLPAALAGATGDLVLPRESGPLTVTVKAMSLADRPRVLAQIERTERVGPKKRAAAGLVVVVADELPEPSRVLLKAHGWGYLDRRGALWLRTGDLLVNDTTITPTHRHRSSPTNPVRGRVGLGVALWVLVHPDGPVGVRPLARDLGASPSSVHEALKRLREHALVDAQDHPLVPELFDAVAAVWRPERVAVARAPEAADLEALGLTAEGSGLVVSGDIGAAALGAPIVANTGAPPDLYVASSAVLRRAVRRLGESDHAHRAATLAVAPAPFVTALAGGPAWAPDGPLNWRPAPAVVVALDLAQDPSRGREILDQWTPDGVVRVW